MTAFAPSVVADAVWSSPGHPALQRGRFGPWPSRQVRDGFAVGIAPDGPQWRGFEFWEASTPSLVAWGWGGRAVDEATLGRLMLCPHAYSGEHAARLLVLREHATGAWHVWTDRFGTLPLYMGPGCLTSCFATALASSEHRLDWHGIAGFLAIGFFLDETTWVRDVRQLPPGSYLRLSSAFEVQKQERWASWDRELATDRAEVETLAGLDAALHAACSRGGQVGPLALPLSGGLDSRMLLAALTSQHAGSPAERLWCFGYGYQSTSIETCIGSELARASGLAFESLTIEPYLFAQIDTLMDVLEGFVDVTQPRQACVARRLGSEADCVVGGHWGDVWFDDMGLLGDAATESDLVDVACRRLLKAGRGWLIDHVLRPALGVPPESLTTDRVRCGLEAYGDIDDLDYRLKAYKTDQWSHRWTLPSLQAYRMGIAPRLPFYEEAFFRFIRTVPSRRLSGRALQLAWIRSRAPNLARVRWQATGEDLFRADRRRRAPIGIRAWRKLLRVLRRQHIVERNWEVQFLREPEGHELKARLLDPGARLHDHVQRREIEDLLAEFFQNPLRGKRGYTVCMLLTLREALERYA